jgi:hypothetical protein
MKNRNVVAIISCLTALALAGCDQEPKVARLQVTMSNSATSLCNTLLRVKITIEGTTFEASALPGQSNDLNDPLNASLFKFDFNIGA